MGVEVRFRRRLRALVLERFGSLDRLYLETDFSKGHLSQILTGKRSPTLATVVKLATLLGVEFEDLFRAEPSGRDRPPSPKARPPR